MNRNILDILNDLEQKVKKIQDAMPEGEAPPVFIEIAYLLIHVAELIKYNVDLRHKYNALLNKDEI